MREIKFRVFDKDTSEMHICSRSHDSIMFMPDDRAVYYNLQNGEGSLNEDSSYVLMQYTGLKDKNGKNIYEGDIVRNYLENSSADYLWLESGDLGYVDRKISIPEVYQEGLAENCEVIGNIYENPDLLEPLKDEEEVIRNE